MYFHTPTYTHVICLANDQPRPKPKNVVRDDPEYVPPSALDSRGGARVGGTSAAHLDEGSDVILHSASSVVRFMWQPLSEITYLEITLLASFEVSCPYLYYYPHVKFIVH